ncbi:MAG TPA: hypothetical protein VLE44_02395 [Candidatus Saccharimonadales bacterium]|nr:hypothetical protein [Candidatus Saccharimonadales bacterium]
MSPEYKIREETPPTEESCMDFIQTLMSRKPNHKEFEGLKSLIGKYGPAEIQGQAADLMREAEQMAEESETPWIDKYLKKYSQIYPTVHTWMARRIERQRREDNLVLKSAQRIVINQVLNSPTGRSSEDLTPIIHSLDEMSRK